jgi:hypothetical protein
MIIYAGDAKDVVKRIRSNHCSGNVEASALRRSIASLRGYALSSAIRPSGTRRVRINSRYEEKISCYVSAGRWKFVICHSVVEAHDFQWYVIEALKPLLNKNRRAWNGPAAQRYADLLAEIERSGELESSELVKARSGPGVYVFYHTMAIIHRKNAAEGKLCGRSGRGPKVSVGRLTPVAPI